MQHMSDARYKLSHLVRHTIAMCGVTTGIVAVGNEIQLCCSCLTSLYIYTIHLGYQQYYDTLELI